MFSLVVGRPKMPGIIVGMDGKHSTAVASSWLVRPVLRCILFGFRQAQDAVHHGRYGPEGQLRIVFVAAFVVDNGSCMAFCK